ncbi:MAG: DUF711 family protein, partial [Ktedonobacteraceae bacterium]|nr:DUF711 family protein [Ktedonobacteraceae bacterium]
MHPVRTITLGLAEPHPIATSAIRRAAAFLRQTRTRFTEAGHEVQTVRLSTRPLFDDMADQSNTTIARYVSELQRALNDLGLEYCSIGPAPAARVHFPLDRLDLVADLLIANPAINATVQLAESINTQPAWRPEAAVPTARIIKRLAAETAEGFGNFRFAALACMPPGTPFFPAAYHDPATFTGFSLGLQGASIIAEAISTLRKETPLPLPLERITEHVGQALISQQWTYRKLTYPIEQEYNIRYAGIDHSPAPLADDSIAAAIELCG